jgi:hypothetical protein
MLRMTRVLALVILSALLSACTATFTPDSSRASWTQEAPTSWMGNFYSGSGPMGASGGGP